MKTTLRIFAVITFVIIANLARAQGYGRKNLCEMLDEYYAELGYIATTEYIGDDLAVCVGFYQKLDRDEVSGKKRELMNVFVQGFLSNLDYNGLMYLKKDLKTKGLRVYVTCEAWGWENFLQIGRYPL